MNVLELERRTYEALRAELLAKAHGKHVLIKGIEVIGLFESEDEGLATAYRQFGPRASFYLHRIETVEEEELVHLGILSAGR